jgi:AraC family transcriptional regulator
VNRASRLEYVRRVNRVIDHVRDHLGEDLSLAALARLAAFSSFHFHRVFRAVTGEPVFGFIQRLRIEGRPTSCAMTRSAASWRWRKAKEAAMNVQVRQAPPHHVAYMRYVGPYGPYGIPELWMKLRTWIDAHGLASPDTVTLGVAHDDPSITAPAQCQYDACVVVPPDFAADRAVNVMDVAGGRCAVAQFEGTAQEIQGAWDRVFSAWLPGSGYQPDDRPCYELYRGSPMKDMDRGVFHCELYLPVRPL